MKPDFWHDRWAENKIGFHQQEINNYLKTFWPRLGLKPGDTIFVPLCGKSLDLLWLSRGFQVVGVEISQLAVESFFDENGLQASVSEIPGFKVYEAAGLRILCGDYFDLNSSHLGTVSGVFDRASLIALPPEMRQRYADHTQTILSENTPILLVALEYLQDKMDGPPFSVDERELRTLYHGAYQVNPLHREDMLKQNPKFRERGLTELWESVYLLNPPA